MNDLAIKLKLLNLYSHMAHNLIKGDSFFADHEMLGSIYEKADDHYDAVVERMIGLGQAPDIQAIVVQATIAFRDKPKQVDAKGWLKSVLQLIEEIMQPIMQLCKASGTTEGTKQLVGGIADEWEVVKYKLKQRVG